jgi:hypothetical protein
LASSGPFAYSALAKFEEEFERFKEEGDLVLFFFPLCRLLWGVVITQTSRRRRGTKHWFGATIWIWYRSGLAKILRKLFKPNEEIERKHKRYSTRWWSSRASEIGFELRTPLPLLCEVCRLCTIDIVVVGIRIWDAGFRR